jgi:hypothetical protein
VAASQDEEEEENGGMSFKKICAICSSHPDLYDLPLINEKLFLQVGLFSMKNFVCLCFFSSAIVCASHSVSCAFSGLYSSESQYHGFQKIKGLAQFTDLKCLWLQNNLIRHIGTGLQPLSQLTQLYINNNNLAEIEGLETLVNLTDLVLSNNNITKIEGLQTLKKLVNLNLAGNTIRSGLGHLQYCDSLESLDLKNNQLQADGTYTCLVDGEEKNYQHSAIEALSRLPNLKVLYLKGNPVVRSITGYRRKVITDLKSLTFLDDRRVQEVERVAALAHAEGGMEAERAARAKFYEDERKLKLEKHYKWAELRANPQKAPHNRTDFGGKITSIQKTDMTKASSQEKDGLVVGFAAEAAPQPVVEAVQESDRGVESKGQVTEVTEEDTDAEEDIPIQLDAPVEWTETLNDTLFDLCSEHMFNFTLVSEAMPITVSVESCRERYAQLEAEGFGDEEDSESESEEGAETATASTPVAANHLDEMD